MRQMRRRGDAFMDMDMALDHVITGGSLGLLETLQQLLGAGFVDSGSTLGAYAHSAARATVILTACGRSLERFPNFKGTRFVKSLLRLPCLQRYLATPSAARGETLRRLAQCAARIHDVDLDHMLWALGAPTPEAI